MYMNDETVDGHSKTIESAWQWRFSGSSSGEGEEVLREVFSWLDGETLARVSAVCRAWRQVALEAHLWRNAILRNLSQNPSDLVKNLNCDKWRREYILTASKWDLVSTLAADAPLEHLLLAPSTSDIAKRFATAHADASVNIWDIDEDEVWTVQWSKHLESIGWASCSRVQWAPEDPTRLLAIGPLALASRWEVAVLQICDDSDDKELRVECRAACGVGGTACWASDSAFLALEPRRLATRLHITTIWLNAATQGTHSEFAGVMSPVLQVFNEAVAHITHAVVVDIANNKQHPLQLLVLASGEPDGAIGVASSLAAWWLSTASPPPLHATETLAERIQRKKLRENIREEQENQPEPPELKEEDARAMTTPPFARCCLGTRILGVITCSSGRAIWTSTESEEDTGIRMFCVELPSMVVLKELSIPGLVNPTRAVYPYYVQPAVSTHFIGSPSSWSQLAYLWRPTSGVRCLTPLKARSHLAVALAFPGPYTAMLASNHHIHTIITRHSMAFIPSTSRLLTRATANALETCIRACSHRKVPESCTPREVPDCPPCEPRKKPDCRASTQRTRKAVRILCCPPERSCRPPCAPEKLSCEINCDNIQQKGSKKNECLSDLPPDNTTDCGLKMDVVSKRLAHAELFKRRQYEKEASQKPVNHCPKSTYKIQGERSVIQTVDGSLYAKKCDDTPKGRCGPGRTAPEPESIELLPDSACKPQGKAYLDPCAHKPQVILHIDRSQVKNKPCAEEKKDEKQTPTQISNKGSCKGITSRLLESFNKHLTTKQTKSVAKHSCPPPCTNSHKARAGDSKSWCESMPAPVATPKDCKEPTIAERLRNKAKSQCGCNDPKHKNFHTSAIIYSNKKDMGCSHSKPQDSKDLASNDKHELKEAGRGRRIIQNCQAKSNSKKESTLQGILDMRAPPGFGLRVQVCLEGDQDGLAQYSAQHMTGSHNKTISPREHNISSWQNLKKKISSCLPLDHAEDKQTKNTNTPPRPICSVPNIPSQTLSKHCPPKEKKK